MKKNSDVSKMEVLTNKMCVCSFVLVLKTYLYSEYASNIDSCTAVATKNEVKLRQLTVGHPVWACGVETLLNEKMKHKIKLQKSIYRTMSQHDT